MCNAIRNGGNRCPVHQHQNIANIRLSANLSGLTRHQTERLFAELRREGRNSPAITEVQREASLKKILDSAEGSDVENAVKNDIEKSKQYDHDIDGATAYAQRLLMHRAMQRSVNLQARFRRVASKVGLTAVEVEAKYKEFMSAVDTSRNAPVDPEFNQNTRRSAEQANLPYDRASVVALEKLDTLTITAPQRRVTHIPSVAGSHLYSYGYDEGRLEIVFGSNTDKIYAYKNIPERLWTALSESRSPGTIFARQIRGQEDYQYENDDEAQADAFAVKCESCGQFRASAHSCPERETRVELEAEGLTANEIIDVIRNTQGNVEVLLTQEEALAELHAAQEAIQEIDDARNLDEMRLDGRIHFVSLDDDDDDVEPEVEDEIEETPEVEVRVARPRTPRPVVEKPFVLAAPDMESTQAEPPRERQTFDDSALRSGIKPVVDDLPELYTHVVTSKNQFVPEKYDKSNLAIAEGGFYMNATMVNSGNAQWKISGLENRMDPDEYKKIMGAEPTIQHVVTTDEDSSVTVRHSYDNREVMGVESYVNNRPRDKWRSPYTYKLFRRGNLHPELSFTQEEHAELVQTENRKLEALLAEKIAVHTPINATETRKYTFDANLTDQPHIRIGKATTIKKAIKEGHVVITPVSVRLAPTNSYGVPLYVDDQGYQMSSDRSTIVTGDVAFRRNADGVMETISTGRKLKCSCYDYRQKYYCQHINYVQRHIGNVAQQMVYTPPTTTEDGQPARHALLSSVLANRGDVTVVEGATPADAYVSFGSVLGHSRRIDSMHHSVLRLQVPANIAGMSRTNPTSEEVEALYENNEMKKRLNTISVPTAPSAIRNAIKRSDVEIPVDVNLDTLTETGRRSYRNDISVRGSIRFAKTTGDLTDVKVVSHTLKCNCPEYAEKYDCVHVRFTLNQGFAIMGAGSRQESEARRLAHFAFTHQDVLEKENDIRRIMLRTGEDRETAVRKIAEREEAQRMQREINERHAELERIARREQYEKARQAERDALQRLNRDVIADSVKYREAIIASHDNPDETYAENPQKFLAAYRNALKRKRSGEHAIPYKTENVINNSGVAGARKFGVELEFVISGDVDEYQALRNIAQDLHAAGLTDYDYQQDYHAAKEDNGYGSWSFEKDQTVDGEVVSPILDDSPESWEQLSQVIEIIRKNGGVTNSQCGSHVHVSSASYEMSTAKNAELLRQSYRDKDIIKRLTSNPATGFHRGTTWCAANVIDERDDLDDTVNEGHGVLGWQFRNHSNEMNFSETSQTNFTKSNIEFRAWDGTLDRSVIQQQIAVSVALMDRAERAVIKNGGSKKPKEVTLEIGSNRMNEIDVLEKHNLMTSVGGVTQKMGHSDASFLESEGEHGAFFDSLFSKDEHREAAVALFAITNWQRY